MPPTDTSVPPVTETPVSPATDTPQPTDTSQPLPETETLTPGPTETVLVTETPPLTPTAVITLTPTLTPTATLTPTIRPAPANLSLSMAVEPAFVTAGELVTVTLTLSLPTVAGQIPVETLTLSSTLPAELSYDTPMGAVSPGFNPIARLLTWQLPPELTAQPSLTVGFVGRIAPEAPASAVNLVAELGPPAVQAQASLIIIAPTVVTPTPVPAGPPARIQLGIEPIRADRQAPEPQQWLAVYVTDADGLAVTDGTEVTLAIQGGSLDQTLLKTQDGLATVRFKTPAKQSFTLTAQAGSAQGSLTPPANAADQPTLLHEALDPAEYDEEIRAMVNARNALKANGDTLTADNLTRRIDFNATTLTFHFKQQDDDLKGEDPEVAANKQLTLAFQLTGLRVGQQSLLTDGAQKSEDNWITYQPASGSWQMAYEISEASVEQYFIFEKGTPTDGDLVIEGLFQTRLQPVLISNDEGIQFFPPKTAAEQRGEVAGLGYGPALVTDAQGRRLVAPLQLADKQLRITIPAAWLAQAEFPVVVDPMIGPAALVSGVTGGVTDPTTASDGNKFLNIWSWQGDIYGQLVESDGTLFGDLIPISQAAGSQEKPEVVYNPVKDQYLVVWTDHRYGFTYNTLRGQRLNSAGQLLGEELDLLAPTKSATYSALAASSAGNYLLVWADQSGSSTDIYGQLLNSSGVLSGTRLTLSNAANTQTQPDMAYDSQANTFEVVWSDRRDGSSYDIFGQLVTAGGVISDSNRQLAGPADTKDLTWPVIAANGSSQFLVAWQREVSASNHDLQAQRVAASTGQTSGSLLDVDIQTGSKENTPAVSGTSGGNYLLAWRDDGEIEAESIPSNGTPPGPILVLNDATSGTRDDPAVAHGNGQALVSWTDTSQAGVTTLTGRRVADGGSASGSEVFISPYYSRRERVASASSPTSTESLLAWQQAAAGPTRDVFIQRVDGQGQMIGDPFNLSDHPTDQDLPALAAGQTGYLAVWRDNRDQAATGPDIYGQLLTASGAPTGSLIAINTAVYTQSNPAVAYNSQQNNYLVVWDDNRAGANVEIYGQIVNANGTLGGGFGLSGANTQDYAAVTYNPDQNRYLVVWEDNRASSNDDIYGQVISADGSLVGNNFAIASAGDNQFDPVIAYHPASQTYLAAWWDRRNNNYDIYGQIISTTGILSGSNLPISTPTGTSNDQEYPAIAALTGGAPGQFLVAWQDRRTSSNRDIYGQRVSGAGVLLDEPDTSGVNEGLDPTINIPFETSSAYTERPSLSYNPAAALYLAAWNKRDDGGIYTGRYTPGNPPTGTARFTAAPGSGPVPLVVTFTDTSSGTLASRTWNFGDGTSPITVTTSTPLTHTYYATGTFSVVLTVTNPSGSVVTSTLITVTEQTTPSLTETFESYDLAVDPPFWLDQFYDATSRNDFTTLWSGESRTLGTAYALDNTIYSHYAIPGWASWQNYDYTGRMKMTDPAGGLGLALYSRYPAGEQKTYVLRRYAGTAETEGFHLAAFGTTLKGDTVLDLTPQPNTWYRFRVQAVTLASRVTFRVKVWPEGQAEPDLWQADAYDDSATRSPAGAVGLRTFGPGNKYFDDLGVTPLNLQADFTVSASAGFAPFSPTFTATPLGQVLTYTWNFGDGSALFSSSAATATHTFAEVGSYTISLTVQGPAGTDTLTRPNAILATNINTGQTGFWSLNETSGSRLDSSGYGNHLTPTNVTTATGRVGLAVDLERGNGSYLSIPHSQQHGLAITGSLSLAGWVRLESINANNSMVVAGKFEYGTNNRAYRLEIGADGKPVLVVSPDGTSSANYSLGGPTALATATWYHLAAVFDSQAQSMALYLNGTPVATRSVTYNAVYPSTAPLMLGASLNSGSPAQFYDGLLDEWRVYARPLSQAEVQGLQATTPPTITFSASPLTGTVPITVAFTNTTSGTATYLWNFGNGLTSTLINPTSSFTRPGVYTVSLTATGPGSTATLTKTNYLTFTTGFSQNWRLVTTTVSPPITGEHASAYDSARNRLLLYGGNGNGWAYANTTWEFDGTSWISTTTAVSPTARYGAAMAYDSVRGVMILFGGAGPDDLALNQTWRYTNTTWNLVTGGTVPISRTYAAMTAGANGQLYLFGGNNGTTPYNDLWRYDNGTWTNLASGPPARTLAALAYDVANNRLLLFGGRMGVGTLLNDLWAFNLGNSTWNQLSPSSSPSARMGHTLTYNPATNSVVLVGGIGSGNTLLGDTWHYSQNSWTQVYPTTLLPPRAYHGGGYGGNAMILFSNGEVWKYE